MSKTVLPNGKIKLFSEIGIRDIRNDNIYSEVICKEENEHFFVEVSTDGME